MTRPFKLFHHLEIIAAWFILGATAARASLILYEPFDYGANGNLAGKGSSELGFISTEKWGAQSGVTASNLAATLSFGAGGYQLRTAGGQAWVRQATAGSGLNAYRGIQTNYTGTLFGSYLYQPETAPDNYHTPVLCLASASDSSLGSAEFGVGPDTDGSQGRPRISFKTLNSVDNPANRTPVAGSTYLVLFKITNVNGASGNSVGTMWMLTSDQFAGFKPDGLTEDELNTAAIGTGQTQVFSRAAVTNSARPVMTTAYYLTIREYIVASYGAMVRRFDEIRMGTADLDEVTPLSGAPSIVNVGASNVTASAASLYGTLVSTGAAPTQVICFWGLSDGGQSLTAWTGTNDLGSCVEGSVSNELSNLVPGTPYYHRFYATNALGESWSPTTVSFRTLMNGSAFERRLPVTFNGYARSETLGDFPALVVLSTNLTGFSYDQFKEANGADLRFADASETNALAYEIELWNPEGLSYVWVRVPQVAQDSTIFAYWGRNGTPAPDFSGAAWSTNYAAVWHLGDTNAVIRDATANLRHGTASGNTCATTGLVGRGQEFDGTNDYIATAYGSGLNPSNQPLTYTAWLRSDRPSLPGAVLAQGTASAGDKRAYFGHSGGNWGAGVYNSPWTTAPTAGAADTNSHMISLVFSNNAASFYLDGIYKFQKSYSSYTFDIPLTIGALGVTDTANNWDGIIDEVRVSTVARSSNWVWACAMSVASNAAFQTYGEVEALSSDAPWIVNVAAQNIDTNSVELVGSALQGTTPLNVVCYYGLEDGEFDPSAWMTNTATLSGGLGNYTNFVTGLLPGTRYYYAYWATNSVNFDWANIADSFVTLGAPSVDNAAAIAGQTSAQLRGTVLGGAPAPQTWIYWGTADGGANREGWDQPAIELGARALGGFSADLSGLLANKTYWYRCYVSNSFGHAWAPVSTNFTTLTPTLSIGNAGVVEGAAGSTGSVTFAVTLSAASAESVSVSYATSNGTATVADNDYLSCAGTLVLPPGSVATQIVVQVVGDNHYENNQVFYANLSNAAGATIGTAQGACTITNDDFNFFVRHGGAGLTNGINWANAYDTLQKALDAVPYNTPITVYVQASASGQAYATCARSFSVPDSTLRMVTVSFLGGWQDIDVSPVQTGISRVSDPATNKPGFRIEGPYNYHNMPKTVLIDRFAFTNVTDGISIFAPAGADSSSIFLTVSNTMICARTNGISIDYRKEYPPSPGAGGPARLTADNIDVVASLSGSGDGVNIKGWWDGSKITASGTDPVTGNARVSTISAPNGMGVACNALNTSTPRLTLERTVIHDCASDAVRLSASQPYYNGTVGSNRVYAVLSNCTLAGNGGDGLHLISQTSGGWGSLTNSIFANNSGNGVNLDGGAGVFTCPEGYNVFFNSGVNDIRVNGASQSPAGSSSTADPIFQAHGAKPAPWYWIGSRSSPAYKTASDNGNRGAYQNAPSSSGTVLMIQ